MRRVRALASILAFLSLASDTPAPKPATDFKLVVEFEMSSAEDTDSAELIFHERRVFQHIRKSEEVILIDLENKRVELLDLSRQVQARVSFDRLDRHIATLRKLLLDKATSLEKQGGKANRVTATATRQLVEPGFKVSFDKAGGRLRLTNPVVDVDAVGVVETDADRLAPLGEALLALVKLGSLRNPALIPPYTRLEATSDLVTKHHLRPKDMSFLYRIAGNPVRYRWTYQVDPAVTSREIEAIDRLDRFRARATLMTFDQYEK